MNEILRQLRERCTASIDRAIYMAMSRSIPHWTPADFARCHVVLLNDGQVRELYIDGHIAMRMHMPQMAHDDFGGGKLVIGYHMNVEYF